MKLHIVSDTAYMETLICGRASMTGQDGRLIGKALKPMYFNFDGVYTDEIGW